MPALDPKDRERLIKLLGMTGSSQDGEAINAMRLANKLITDRGLTWGQVLAEKAPSWPSGASQTVWPGQQWSYRPPPPRPPPPPPRAFAWQIVARTILGTYPDSINEWEEHFLCSILGRRIDLTEKQKATLNKIATKCGMPANGL